jgi:hypothetical protein
VSHQVNAVRQRRQNSGRRRFKCDRLALKVGQIYVQGSAGISCRTKTKLSKMPLENWVSQNDYSHQGKVHRHENINDNLLCATQLREILDKPGCSTNIKHYLCTRC